MTLILTSLGFSLGALVCAAIMLWRADVALKRARADLDKARDRIIEVEDKMLVLADRPDAVIPPLEGSGAVTYMDEAKEAQIDADAKA